MTDASYTPPMTSEPVAGRPLDPAGPSGVVGPMLTPEAEPDRIDRESPYYRASQGLALQEVFEDGRSLAGKVFGFISADSERAFDADRRRMFGEDVAPLLSADEANERYGVEGYLRFDRPVDPSIAGWRQGHAQRRAFREEVVANADLSWWQAMGASMAGQLADPLSWPLMLAPELAVGRWLRSGVAATRLGRLPGAARGAITGSAEGLAGGVLYEGANLWIHHELADDYDFGQASANVLLGGLLGAGIGSVGGWYEGRGGRRPRAPAILNELDEDTLRGAFVQALDAVVNDEPVDLGPVLRREMAERAAGRGTPMAPRLLDDLEPDERGAPEPPQGRFETEYGDADGGRAAVWVRPDERLAAAEGLGAEDYVFGWSDDAVLRVERSQLTPAAQGRGLGVAMYERLAREARRTGKALVSDREVSPAAERVWRALERRGYPVEENPKAVRAKGKNGGLKAPDGDPVFTIAALPKEAAPPSAARQMLDGLSAWMAKPGDGPGPLTALTGPEPVRPAPVSSAPAKPKTPKGQAATPRGEPFADPEVAALAADTQAMLAREGIELAVTPANDPQKIADAVASAAACLAAA